MHLKNTPCALSMALCLVRRRKIKRTLCGYFSASLVLVMLLISGCQRRALPPKWDSLEHFAENTALDIKGTLRYQGEDNSFVSTLSVRIQKDSIIWLSATPAFGLEALRGKVDNTKLFLLDRLNRAYYIYKHEELREKWGIPFSYDFAEKLLLGQLPFEADQLKKESQSKEQEEWVGTYGSLSCRLLVHQESGRPSRIEMNNEKGQRLVVEYAYEVAKKEDHASVPSKVTARLRTGTGKQVQQTILQFVLKRVSVLPIDEVSFPFKIPGKYVSGR